MHCTLCRHACNTNGMLTEEDLLSYGYLCDRATRLAGRVDYLREYVLQLRETYRESLDERQNKNTTLLARCFGGVSAAVIACRLVWHEFPQ